MMVVSKLASGGKSELGAGADSVDGIRARMNEIKMTRLGEIEPDLNSFEQASAGVDGVDGNYASESEEDGIDGMARLKLRELDYFDVDGRKMTVSE
ncbi:hypothetical protein PanWU01x14_057670 [Parasponia andersonii]|uniref:Uncharacterized protein n=1 Tax=Parasponia andersonii TaxID=3476 RepID=A0A2P5DK10_PARAD|nr:hypothetical protein PanWU01x14_057670 [Parasponia andersonii]